MTDTNSDPRMAQIIIEDEIATITFDRAAKRNAVNDKMMLIGSSYGADKGF